MRSLRQNILSEAAQCLTRRVSCYQQRRLPLEFSLTTDLKLLPLSEHSNQCAIVVHAPEVQCLELQEPILRLEKEHPKLGRHVWRALHHGFGLLGDYCSPYTLLHLLAMYYWQGEDNEEYVIKELKDQGEDVSQIEIVRRADVERQFPRWVLSREQKTAGHQRIKRFVLRRRGGYHPETIPDNSLECQSIQIVCIPWKVGHELGR